MYFLPMPCMPMMDRDFGNKFQLYFIHNIYKFVQYNRYVHGYVLSHGTEQQNVAVTSRYFKSVSSVTAIRSDE